LCDDAKSFFDGNSDIIKKKWKLMQKLFKPKNKARKECILLPFKTVQKIVSD
jgi:nitrogen fixation NifU-like protein